MVTPSAPFRESLIFDSNTSPALEYEKSDIIIDESFDNEEEKSTPNKINRSISFGDKKP